MAVNKENAAHAVKITRPSGGGQRRAIRLTPAGNRARPPFSHHAPPKVRVFSQQLPALAWRMLRPLDSLRRSSLMGLMGIAISP
jgi:hypothetical protein